MLKQREGYRVIIREPAKSRIRNGLCPTCSKPKYEWTRRTDWACCSTKCTAEFYSSMFIFRGWDELRDKVIARDKNTCVLCHNPHLNSDLIVDHIKPIALDGDEWDPNNCQTLCIDCNKVKTKSDMGNIAEERRRIKNLEVKELHLDLHQMYTKPV